MLTKDFNIETAKNILNENLEYPINFDSLINWCGLIGNRQRYIQLLINNFEVDLDYKMASESYSVRYAINLRIDSSKEFAILVRTEKGRNYKTTFIEAEKELGIFNNNSINQMDRELLKQHTYLIESLQSDLQQLTQTIQILSKKITEQNSLNSNKDKVQVQIEVKRDDSKDKEFREKLTILVNNYVNRTQTKDQDGYRKAWNTIYSYFKVSTGVDIKARARTAKSKNGAVIKSGLDYAQQYRLLDKLYELAQEVI